MPDGQVKTLFYGQQFIVGGNYKICTFLFTIRHFVKCYVYFYLQCIIIAI